MIEKGFSVGFFFFSLSFPKILRPRKEDREMCVYTYDESGLGGSGAGWCVSVCLCRESKERGWEKYGELIWLVAGWDDGQSELSGGAA